MTAADKTNKTFAVILFTTLSLKLILSAWFPVTGDEAYFILWGKYPDYGYYDHPPMIGWWLAAMLRVSDALWWLRLPAVLMTTAIGWVIYQMMRKQNDQLAAWTASIYLLAPVQLLAFVFSTDTPLFMWSFLSVLCFYRAQDSDGMGWYLLSGVLLGAAFLSKFFAGILGIAYVIYIVLFVRRGRKPWQGVLLLFAGTLPALGLNLYWNYNHCWDNYLFNLVNRTGGGAPLLYGVLIYLFILVYAATPPALYFLYQRRHTLVQELRSKEYLFLSLFFIAAIIFFLLSWRKVIGVHWLLSFYPLFFLGLGRALKPEQLRSCFVFMVPFSAIHVLVVFALLVMPLSVFRSWPEPHQFIVFGKHTDEVLAAVDFFDNDYVLATDNYTLSAQAAYRGHRRVVVFGNGSHHGRQDDLLTDFRKLDGRNILVLVNKKQSIKAYKRFFDSYETQKINIRGANYAILLGHGFRYQIYRDTVLTNIRSVYYRRPALFSKGKCYMDNRYFSNAGQT